MRPAILILPLALAACDVQTDDAGGNSTHVSISASGINASVGEGERGDHVSVKMPGFAANVRIAGLNLGGEMDFDGVKMAPDTDVGSMDVEGGNGPDRDDRGTVRIAFTNPRDTTRLIDYYREALGRADFTIESSDGAGLKATKRDKHFDLRLAPQGSGSRGTILITGNDHAG